MSFPQYEDERIWGNDQINDFEEQSIAWEIL
jgi:hypothetical protein